MAIKAKYLAGTSLALMGAGFLGTIPFHHTVAGAVIHGGFEAGLVGGLADWFAVTALFRHPLHIPIPHTALLPKKREKLTNGLVHMIENEWLTKASITDKLQQINLANTLLAVVDKQLASASLQKGVITILEKALAHLDVKKLASFMEKAGKEYLHTIDCKELLSALIEHSMESKYDEKIFDFSLAKLIAWMEKESAKKLLGKMAMNALNNIQQEGFFQFALKSVMSFLDEEKLGTALQNALVKGLPHLSEPDNENRAMLLQQIQQGLGSLKDNEEVIGRVEEWKHDTINTWDASSQMIKLLEHMKEKVTLFIQQEDFYETKCLPFLRNVVKNIKENDGYMAEIEKWIQVQIVNLVEQNHGKIGTLVKENLNKLDNETLVEMIENNVGKELQWIRVNGAVCGFFIGIALEGIKLFF